MWKKKHKRWRSFTFISSSSWRNDNNSNSHGSRKRPRLSRPRRWRGIWKRIRTRALWCCCCSYFTYDFSSSQISRFFQPSTAFFSLNFFSLIHYSFFFFRILGVPFSLVSKKQGREKDSGVLYASSSFPGRRFCWRRR